MTRTGLTNADKFFKIRPIRVLLCSWDALTVVTLKDQCRVGAAEAEAVRHNGV